MKSTGISCHDSEVDFHIARFPGQRESRKIAAEVDRLADQDKLGRPWSDGEIDAIIADYFAMLGDEIAGRPYVKSHHSAALMGQIGRTHRSVEFKHQNISAVLDELGMPWIPGYKPKRNYQRALLAGIDRYLSMHSDLPYEQPEPAMLLAAEESPVFVPPPEPTTPAERPLVLERLVRKFDPVERDFRNRKLGCLGEAFVLEVEPEADPAGAPRPREKDSLGGCGRRRWRKEWGQ